MELGLSLGDKSCETFHEISGNFRDGFTKTTAATPTRPSIAGSSGFCMALTINPSSGSYHGLADDGSNEDNDQTFEKNQEDLRENQRIKAIIDGRQKALKLNPPLQLDLLPPTLVDSQALLPCSSDNGSSQGDSSGNVRATTGFQVKITPPTAASTEEATSFLRLDFCSYGRTSNVLSKKKLELTNDVAVDLERASPIATDEDDNGIYRKKLRLTKQQSAYLEESFKDHSILNPTQKLGLAKQLKLSPRQVEVWFQNRRARTKLKQTEVDYEYLKRCCETLTGENRRLHKELQELRSLKSTSNQFKLQLPATTLTMCPSCERVAQSTITNASVPPITNFQQSTATTPRTGCPLALESRSYYPFFKAPPSDLA